MINSNLFIVGGVASGKTTIIKLFKGLGYKTIDTGLIYRFATYALMNEYHQNQNNLDLESFLTKKSQHLTNMLRKHLSVADNEIRVNGIDDINSTLFSEHINSNIINIAKSKPIRKSISRDKRN